MIRDELREILDWHDQNATNGCKWIYKPLDGPTDEWWIKQTAIGDLTCWRTWLFHGEPPIGTELLEQSRLQEAAMRVAFNLKMIADVDIMHSSHQWGYVQMRWMGYFTGWVPQVEGWLLVIKERVNV